MLPSSRGLSCGQVFESIELTEGVSWPPLCRGITLRIHETSGADGSSRSARRLVSSFRPGPTDPLLYRSYEMVMIQQPALKAQIEEEFGDGATIPDTFACELVGKAKGSERRQSVHPYDEGGDRAQRRH